eukprot:SM000013S26414  [mRNA]  locus=s13:254544:256529:- [translate_table: standard]
MGGRSLVVVVGGDGATAREAIRWAVEKLWQPFDATILLHVAKPPPPPPPPPPEALDGSSPKGGGAAHARGLAAHVQAAVLPAITRLQAYCKAEFELPVEIKVAVHAEKGRGVIEEVKLLTGMVKLVLGRSPARFLPKLLLGKMFDQVTWSIGSCGVYCREHKPPGCSLFVVQKGRLLLEEAATCRAQLGPPAARANGCRYKVRPHVPTLSPIAASPFSSTSSSRSSPLNSTQCYYDDPWLDDDAMTDAAAADPSPPLASPTHRRAISLLQEATGQSLPALLVDGADNKGAAWQESPQLSYLWAMPRSASFKDGAAATIVNSDDFSVWDQGSATDWGRIMRR